MELEINEDKYLNYMVIRIKILEEKYSRGLFEFLLIVKNKGTKTYSFYSTKFNSYKRARI